MRKSKVVLCLVISYCFCCFVPLLFSQVREAPIVAPVSEEELQKSLRKLSKEIQKISTEQTKKTEEILKDQEKKFETETKKATEEIKKNAEAIVASEKETQKKILLVIGLIAVILLLGIVVLILKNRKQKRKPDAVAFRETEPQILIDWEADRVNAYALKHGLSHVPIGIKIESGKVVQATAQIRKDLEKEGKFLLPLVLFPSGEVVIWKKKRSGAMNLVATA